MKPTVQLKNTCEGYSVSIQTNTHRVRIVQTTKIFKEVIERLLNNIIWCIIYNKRELNISCKHYDGHN